MNSDGSKTYFASGLGVLLLKVSQAQIPPLDLFVLPEGLRR